MRSKSIVLAMLDNGMLDPDKHNPNDFITYTVSATKLLEERLKDVKQHEEIAELVASMFDSGFCNRKEQKDPSEWTMFAEAAIDELKVI